jgi:hypothetical protein
MSERAHGSVRESRYRVDAMVESYGRVFEHAWGEVKTGQFVRPRGQLSPPPAEVEGVSVFPVPLPVVEPGVGRFPSIEDAQDCLEQERAAIKGSVTAGGSTHDQPRVFGPPPRLDDIRVMVSARSWAGASVHPLSEDLVRGLQQAGLDARLLLTEEKSERTRSADVRKAIEAAAPCIYLPGDDWRNAGGPTLSDRIIVIGTLHDTGPFATNYAKEWGDYWNAVVATNLPVARHVRRILPRLEGRLAIIPHGLTIPAGVRTPSSDPDGRFGVLIVEPDPQGGDGDAWVAPLTRWLVDNQRARVVRVNGGGLLNRQEWFKTCSACRFVVTGGQAEETRRMTIEAMGHGCIPLTVSEAGRGWDAVAQDIGRISADPGEHARLAAEAHQSARTAGYRTDQMIGAYLDLFGRLVADAAAGRFQRPGRPVPPQAAR